MLYADDFVIELVVEVVPVDYYMMMSKDLIKRKKWEKIEKIY